MAARRRYRRLLDGLELKTIWRISSGGKSFPLDELAMRPVEAETTQGRKKWLTSASIGIQSASIA